jgi:hypothetical protein
MDNPFTVHPGQIPSSDGVPSNVTYRVKKELEAGFTDEFSLPQKRSSHSTLLGENEERWSQEIRQALLAQHPWLSGYTITDHMTASSPEGYATGFFRITPRHIPIATAGAETVSVVTVPFVVRDFQLYPLDLFSHDGKSYPLTEERVAPLLRVRDAFREVDREQVQLDLLKDVGPFTMGPAAARGLGHWSSYMKYSGAEDFRQVVAAAAEELSGAPVLTEETANSGLSESIKDRLRKESSIAAADIQITSESARYRVAWASSPEDGTHSVTEWANTSLPKLSSLFGADTVELALATGRVVLNKNPEDPEALLVQLVPKVSQDAEALVSSAPFHKESTACPASVVKVVSAKGDDTAIGVKVNHYVGAGDRMGSMGPIAVLCMSGRVAKTQSCDAMILAPNEAELAAMPGSLAPTHHEDFGMGCGCRSSFMAVWEQDSAVYGVSVDPSTVVIDGLTYYRAHDGYETPVLVCFSAGFENAYSEMHGDTQLLHLPERAWLVGPDSVIKPGSPISYLIPSAVPVPLSLPDVELDHKVAVAHVSGRWHVRGSIDHGVSCRDADDVRFALAASGVPEDLAEAVLKTSQTTSAETTINFRAPHFDEGEKIVISAARSVAKLLNDNQHVILPAANRIKVAFRELKKASSALDNTPAVDTVLSLGFLTKDNLLKFVAMRPTFEKTLSYLCALLLSSRLGLDEVDSSAVESSIRGLDEVLSSLRSVEYALTQR